MEVNLKFYFIFILCYQTLNIFCKPPKGNVFTAISHMEPLLGIEERLMGLAREYLNNERRKLGELRGFAKSVEEAMELSKDEPLKYLGNPINSYLIIKRFTSGWRELASRLEIDDSKIEEMKTILNSNDVHLPLKDVDLLGATVAIFRLQDTYQITAQEISDGRIKDVSPSAHQLTAEDCMHISDYAHSARRYIRMQEWAKEAERILDDPSLQHRVGNVTRLSVYEVIGWTAYLSNDMEEALKYTKLVLEIDPKNKLAIKNEEIYRWYVQHNEKSRDDEAKWMDMDKEIYKRFAELEYVQACRNLEPVVLNVKNKANLVCFMKTDHPLLILKPIKATRYHDNPEVIVFHDVINDKEMKTLQKIATPFLKQARVVEEDITEADYRVAKTMFMMDHIPGARKISDHLNVKFEAITGLSIETAEELQVNNYGLGGQYEFHIDHGEGDDIIAHHRFGNRIATLLCYLSDVERGGETVFTKLGLSIRPKKGDALFWYNLFLNGDGNPETQHASCPVVSGSKWVANKWFHLYGNEFRRKCSLNKDE